jgi:hypothetical protein
VTRIGRRTMTPSPLSALAIPQMHLVLRDLRISEIKDALRIEGGSLSSAESSIRALGTVLQVHSEPQEEDG